MLSNSRPDTGRPTSREKQKAVNPFQRARGTAIFPDDDWVPTTITGVARLANDRGIDVQNLSRSYGIILGRQMLELRIDDMIPECIIDGIYLGWREDESPMDLMHFETLMQGLMDENASSSTPKTADTVHAVDEMFALSQMYGFLLGTTLKMSCLELDLERVAEGFRGVCVEPDLQLPLLDKEYDRQFMEVQQIAAALMHDINLSEAERFFASAKGYPGIRRASEDDSILFMPGSYVPSSAVQVATKEDRVNVIIAGRLLDGRSFLVPTFSKGNDQEADSVSIPLAGVPDGLAAGIVGMREGEVRVIYVHPKVTDGVSALFSAQPFPLQSAIIFEVKLLSVLPQSSDSKQSEPSTAADNGTNSSTESV